MTKLENLYDYIDLGCSKGDSMLYLQNLFPNKNALGIDTSEKKIDIAMSRGLNVLNIDLFSLPNSKLTNFVTMFHILEHLNPDEISIYEFIKKTVIISKEFIFIRQPYFDSDESLKENDLKFFWSDWDGHPNRMLYRDFVDIFTRLKEEGMIQSYKIYGYLPVKDSKYPAVLPLSAPPNQTDYDKEKHGRKNIIDFKFFAFREIMAVAWIGDEKNESSQKLIDYCKDRYEINF
jgi:hypothetical protein